MTPPDDSTEVGSESGESSGDDGPIEHSYLQKLIDERRTPDTELGDLEAATNKETVGLSEFRLVEETPGLLSDRDAVSELVETYGFVRGYFISRASSYREFQRILNQARWGTTYDRYLTQVTYLSAIAALVGLALGGLFGWWLSTLGVFAGIRLPFTTPGFLPRWFVTTVSGRRGTLGIGLLMLTGGLGLAAVTWYSGKAYVGQRVHARSRNINLILPDAIVFMYALSESGMNLVDIIENLADSEDAYGDVASEFDMIRRDIKLYGNDLYTSLRHARNLTPSENLEQFIDDLLSLLDSGGETTTFLRDQSQTYLGRAKEEQEDLLTFLALLSEVFIVGFVAAPLFLIVILMIISLLGEPMVLEMAVFIYLALPMAFFGFGVLLSVLLDPYVEESMTLDVDSGNNNFSNDIYQDKLNEDSEYKQFQRLYRLKRLWYQLGRPLAFFREKPNGTILVTGALITLYLSFLYSSGLVPTSIDGWIAAPIAVTNRVIIVPLLVVCIPLSVLHELDRRRQNEITERFPNTLNVLSSANSMGISLEDALGVVARTSSGHYARELRILQNDIRWSNDASGALLRFANRLDVAALSRTIKLIAEGRRSTTDLSRVLRIATKDTRNRFRLIRKRQQEMLSYVAVVIISYLVFLGVIVILDQSYLTPISQLPTPESGGSAIGGPTSLATVPVDSYRLLFFHAVIVQALGTGSISGLLSDNSLKTGLKYSIILIILAVITFTVL